MNSRKKKLIDIVRKMHGKRVLVMGDPILDVYHFGEVTRTCPEAPVPVFVQKRTEGRRGGAANVQACLQRLTLSVDIWFPSGPRETKTRYMVGQHMLLRVDEPVDYAESVIDWQFIPYHRAPDAAVISDYAKGWVTAKRCAEVMKLKVPVVVDPKGSDWSKYMGASVVCPNAKEILHMPKTWKGEVLYKMGASGLALLKKGTPYFTFAPEAARVYDVTGAGDMVVAVMAAAMTVTKDLTLATQLAGIAAAWSVGQVGTVSIDPYTLIKEIESCASVS